MDKNPYSLEGQNVLVTGASSGIGRAIAVESSRMGAHVTALGRDQCRLDQTVAALEGKGHQAVRLDLCDDVQLERMVSALDSVDGVVNAAGLTRTAPAKFIDKADFDEIMAVNVYAPMKLMKHLLTYKKLNNAASLVFISSVVGGILPYKGQGVYAASKGALSAYAKVLALELSSRKIRVNSVAPAMVRTRLLDTLGADAEALNEDEKRYPLGYGTPEDVAWAVVYLLSNASRWMTGNILSIDGGVTLTK
jgi:NAD(P)-dependent dehydrogenase (short-subunit alcohol dehydrogenase family)